MLALTLKAFFFPRDSRLLLESQLRLDTFKPLSVSIFSAFGHANKHFFLFFESEYFIYSVRNIHSRETEQHYLNIVM